MVGLLLPSRGLVFGGFLCFFAHEHVDEPFFIFLFVHEGEEPVGVVDGLYLAVDVPFVEDDRLGVLVGVGECFWSSLVVGLGAVRGLDVDLGGV